MTFTHFVNCVALTYAPIYVIYSAKNLSDQKIGSFFYWGILYYIAANLTKMLLYATVIPLTTIEAESYNLSQEIFKIIINCVEVAFILMALRNKSSFKDSEADLKITVVALAWSLSENVFSYFLEFLFHATSEEFQWNYIQTAISANIDLLERLAIIAVVECFRKYNEMGKVSSHFIILLIIKYSINNLGTKYIPFMKSNDQWSLLGYKFIITLAFSLFVKVMFNIIQNQNSSDKEDNNTKKLR